MSEMDNVVQANAANAEETASASEELSAQSNELKNMVKDLTKIIEGSDSENEPPLIRPNNGSVNGTGKKSGLPAFTEENGHLSNDAIRRDALLLDEM